jgi:hypothetical protein
VASLTNELQFTVNQKYSRTWGYSETITKTSATSTSTTTSVTASVSGKIKGLNLGLEVSTQTTKEHTTSLENAQNGFYQQTVDLEIPVPRCTCIMVLQLQADTRDLVMNAGMSWKSSRQWVTLCDIQPKESDCKGDENGGHSRSAPPPEWKKDVLTKDEYLEMMGESEEAAVAKGRASQGPAPDYVPPSRVTSSNAGIGKKKALSHEEAVGGFCACSATSDMCHHDFGGRFRCVVPANSRCADKTEMVSHPGIFESQIACNQYKDGEDQTCYFKACKAPHNCIHKQHTQLIYKASSGLCYKAKTDCLDCLADPAKHPRDLQLTSCPSKRCDLDALAMTTPAVEDPSRLVQFFALVGFGVVAFGAVKHYAGSKSQAHNPLV